MNTKACGNHKKTCTFFEQKTYGRLPSDKEKELALIAKALGHPVRVKILTFLLFRKECFCGEICRELPLAQSTVSQHLHVLKEAGLIKGEVEEPRVCYCANIERLEQMRILLKEMLEIHILHAQPDCTVAEERT